MSALTPPTYMLYVLSMRNCLWMESPHGSTDMATKRRSYTTSFKLKVVEDAEKKKSNRAVAKEYGVNEKLVRDWRKKKDALMSMPKAAKSERPGGKPHWPELEEKLQQWVLDKRLNGIGVSGTMIRLMAKRMAKDMPPDKVAGFTGSSSWLYRFMKRKKLVIRAKTRISQRLPKEFEEHIVNFQRKIIRMRQANQYDLQQIGNMDETPMNFDMPLSRTVDTLGNKSILIKTTGNEKNHFTVVLACMADGSKLPPMIIFKRKTMPKEKIPSRIVMHVHEKGWMDENGMMLWISRIWHNRPGGLFKKKACLVYDMFKAHLMDSIKTALSKLNTDIAIIPGGLTSQLQPLDVSINKPFKDRIRVLWSNWIADDSEHVLTKGGRLKKPSITLICNWVLQAWQEIDPIIIVKAFKKCCISNALDGSEDDVQFENESDSESEIDPFADISSDENDHSDI